MIHAKEPQLLSAGRGARRSLGSDGDGVPTLWIDQSGKPDSAPRPWERLDRGSDGCEAIPLVTSRQVKAVRERARIAAVLADLPASWGQVRKVLNELQAIVGE
jgi:hypothetical protein